jgi:hypothetical protein
MRTLLGAVVLGAVTCSGACVVVDRMSGTSQARAIQATGEQAEATVLEIWDTGITVNDDPVVGLRVRVETGTRAPYEARIEKSRVSRVHIPQVQPGSRVPVFVDPRDPTRVALGLYKY